MADQTAQDHKTAIKERKYRAYSFEDRVKVIKLSESGMSSFEISSMTGIDDSLIRYWVRRYRQYGIEGLKRKRYATPLPSAGSQCTKGFVRFVDNPEILHSQVEKLTRAGVETKDIVISSSASSFLSELTGCTVVVNSLFDFSTDFSEIVSFLVLALKKNVTVLSLKDKNLEINPKDKNTLGILEALGRYAHNTVNFSSARKKEESEKIEMKRNYERMVSSPMAFEAESVVLTGSLTEIALEVNDVQVEEFQKGFDEGGNDFKTISFD